ncbi:hypothetical protein [Cloacibacillus evryensis]|jgi:hypothetical protein|uniref:Uncharacterized protein n=2 Tax=Cloacibacillus evryensis TaxID=508460 RepID=A0AAW5K2P3_9BACT|nr:hypothetical protein [Cloacibacillus evryensis]EHL68431.1 hypothetical protein HMPREF1006_02454 [Synergistes sp. 3_1_syn1]MCQ4814217.1 hypothetical protein [Cloacibacillus evryensis]
MNITTNENGDFVISNIEGDCFCSKEGKAEMLERFVRIIDCSEKGDKEADTLKSALNSLLHAYEYAEKQDDFNKLVWLNECHLYTQDLAKRITERAKSDEAQINKDFSQKEPYVIACPACGGTAKLMYRGYLSFYTCSKCGIEGDLSEEIEEAAYKWNSHSAIENLKDAVRIAENHHVDAGMLNRMAIGILEQIYRKGGVLHGELAAEIPNKE